MEWPRLGRGRTAPETPLNAKERAVWPDTVTDITPEERKPLFGSMWDVMARLGPVRDTQGIPARLLVDPAEQERRKAAAEAKRQRRMARNKKLADRA